MEVPCCFGLFRVVMEALEASGKARSIPIRQEVISIEEENWSTTLGQTLFLPVKDPAKSQ